MLGVVRIDDERFGQLARSARDLRQDERAALVVARRDELLGDEVHAVVQAGDEAHVGRTIMRVDLVGLVMLDLQNDRLAVRRAEAIVDALEPSKAVSLVKQLVDIPSPEGEELECARFIYEDFASESCQTYSASLLGGL